MLEDLHESTVYYRCLLYFHSVSLASYSCQRVIRCAP